jgi:transcriptional regulator with XRE-family HTH domain
MMRQTHEVSLRQMAKIVGISPSHLSRVEKGKRSVTPTMADRICTAIASLPVPEHLLSKNRESFAWLGEQ